MNWLKLGLKIFGTVGAIYGGYEIGEAVGDRRAMAAAEAFNNQIKGLANHVLNFSAKTNESITALQLSIFGLFALIAFAFVVFGIWCLVQAAKNCISKSVEKGTPLPASNTKSSV